MKYIIEPGMKCSCIRSWCNYPEKGAEEQAKNLAQLPFIFSHICLMPDTHQGYGMPIGGVMATKGVIVPNAVGVDIGCGMRALQTNLKDITVEQLKTIFGGSSLKKGGIRSKIPTGFNKHKRKQDETIMPTTCFLPEKDSVVHAEWNNALHSLGTLGGGNHFIEIQKGSDGFIWVMLHSGSRNLGKKVAEYYNKKAIDLNEKWFSSVPKKWELAFLPLLDDVGQHYLSEMKFCVEYAKINRYAMMEEIKKVLIDEFGEDVLSGIQIEIDIAHNYARMENHFGENVLVHRKGATSASAGEIGIIPGSQGTRSYIVKGKGNEASFKSCSHGAGRKMSRTAAGIYLNLDEEIKKLEDKNIVHSIRSVSDLDEASGAYKDIDVVMSEQEDLVDILVTLEPLAVIKG